MFSSKSGNTWLLSLLKLLLLKNDSFKKTASKCCMHCKPVLYKKIANCQIPFSWLTEVIFKPAKQHHGSFTKSTFLVIFNQTTILPSYQPCRRKTSTTVLATQTHSSMQDKASEVVALGGFNFVSHLSRLTSKLKVISDKMWQVFLCSIREFETFSSTLRTLHEQCLGLWVSDCGMLCLGTISKHLPSIPIHHPPTGLDNDAAAHGRHCDLSAVASH